MVVPQIILAGLVHGEQVGDPRSERAVQTKTSIALFVFFRRPSFLVITLSGLREVVPCARSFEKHFIVTIISLCDRTSFRFFVFGWVRVTRPVQRYTITGILEWVSTF